MSETDWQLLDRYARFHAEEAFAELVRRHLNLVFSAALRPVRSPQLAEEVAQSVFTDLARRAPDLAPDTNLSAWLYAVTRRTAIDVVRRESRRQLREQIACEIIAMNAATADWTHIEPLLDEAMDELAEADRTAILLRYFEDQSLRMVGEALGTTDDAAQKRVSRAVERLREFLQKRGVAVGAGGLVALISAQAVQAAPAGLAAIIAPAALAGTSLSTSTLLTVTKTMAMTTLQKTLITAALVAGVGSSLYEAHLAAQMQRQLHALQQQQARWVEQAGQWQREQAEATNQLAVLQAENARLNANANRQELLKLRGQVSQMQSAASDPTAVAAQAWLAKVHQLKQRLEQTPDAKIPEMTLLTEQDWLAAAKGKLDTDTDYRRAFAGLRSTAENEFGGQLVEPALESYAKANAGSFPTDVSQLQPYFTSPVDAAILQRWEVEPASVVRNVGVGDQVITEKAPVDDLLDSRMAIGPNGYGSVDFLTTETQDALKPVYNAYHAANGAIQFGFEISQLMPYATTPEQQVAVQKMMDQAALRK